MSSGSLTFPEPTNITQQLLDAGIQLLDTRLPSGHLPVRRLCFGVTGLHPPGTQQQQLFVDPERERSLQLDLVADQIADQFGRRAVRRGAALLPDRNISE